MTTVNIGNEQVEIDVLDLEFLSKFESGVADAVPKKINALKSSESVSVMLTEAGRTMVDFFDSLFGEGFSLRAYNGRANLRDICRDYAALVNAASADFAPAANEIAQLFSELPCPHPQTDKATPSLFG